MYTKDAETTALQALAWIVGDPALRPRLLGLTGLDADGLRAGAGDPALLAAVLDFLMAHEPNLTACAAALDMTPEALVAARGRL